MAKVIVKETHGNWKIGTINGIAFQAKVYDEDSEFGIDGGNVSKLWIQGICNYDREWDEHPNTAKGKAMVNALVAYFWRVRGAA